MLPSTIAHNAQFPQAPVLHNRPTPPHWTRFFSPEDAMMSLFAHIETRASAHTTEKNTRKTYEISLRMWHEFAGDALPTPKLMQSYINYLLHQKGLKPSSITVRLAPIRIYLKALANQPTIGYVGHDRDLITEYREQIRSAIDVKNPPPATKSNYGPLFNPEFVRLEQNQVNLVLLKIDRDSLQGKRDYALLMTAFYTALRLSELTRITLNTITPVGDSYQITVRGKRGTTDPVPLSRFAYNAIMEWVTAYNGTLDNFDYASTNPPRIEGDVPVWQPLEGENTIMQVGRAIGTGVYDPCAGLLHKGLRGIIANRTASALGERYRMAAHDTRRTAAYVAYKAGMPLTAIQKLLRHKDASTTLRYIGASPDLQASDFGTYGVVFGFAS